MKILLLGGASSRNGGGVFHVLHRLGHSLQQLPGTEVHFLLYEDEHSAADREHFGELPVHYYRTKGPLNFAYSPDLEAQMEVIAPDVIHVAGLWLYLSLVNSRYCRRTSTPYVISPHGMLDHWQLHQSPIKDLTKALALRGYEGGHLRQAAALHALNDEERKAIQDFGLTNRIAIIPNGTDLPSEEDLTDELPLAWPATKRKTLLFLSRVHPKKGLDNLLTAWAATRPEQHNWQLIIAGESADPSYWERLQTQRDELGITGTCLFIGGQYRKAKVSCLRAADAFILPSFSEGLPMAILEAWSYELPVLMTAECNLPEGFSAGAALRIGTDAPSISDGIQRMISLPVADRQQLGVRGRALVEQSYTWSSVATATYNLYADLLGWPLEQPTVTSFSIS